MQKLQSRDTRAKEFVAFILRSEAERVGKVVTRAAEINLATVVDDLSEVAATLDDLFELLTGRRPE